MLTEDQKQAEGTVTDRTMQGVKRMDKGEIPEMRRENELKRLEEMYVFENEAFGQGYEIVAGMDEAGRGLWLARWWLHAWHCRSIAS